MSKRLVILGASGHGRVAAEIGELTGYSDIVFLDPSVALGDQKGAWPVQSGDDDDSLRALAGLQTAFFVGIGNNALRARLMGRLQALALPCAVLVHPNACVSRHADIAEGTLIAAGATVTPFARIGTSGIVNTGASVDHDCLLAPNVHIGPGARLAANVSVGARVNVGIGAVVRQGIRIGADAVVGAGAAVVSDIPDGWIVAGVPAKRLAAPIS